MRLASVLGVLVVAITSPAIAQDATVTWTELVPATSARGLDAAYGRSVAVDADHVAVARIGRVTLFHRMAGGAVLESGDAVAASGDSAGFGVSLALAGDQLFVGAHSADGENGAVYRFVRSAGGTWDQAQRLTDPMAIDAPLFGFALSTRGGALAVGAPYFARWTSTAGRSITLLPDTAGSYTFEAANESRSAPSVDAYYGWSVSLGETRIAVGQIGSYVGGAGAAGSVVIADLSRPAGTRLLEIPNPRPDEIDQCGHSVALGTDVVAFGCRYEDAAGFDAGAVYVADATTGVLRATFEGPAARARLGDAVAMDEGWIVAGAPAFQLGGELGGMRSFVELYQRLADGTWVRRGTFEIPGGETDAQFGRSVAIHQRTIVVGAPSSDAGGVTNAGQAWVGIIEPDVAGTACGADGDCASGLCAAGVCCDAACTAACESCVAAETGGADGTCALVPGCEPDAGPMDGDAGATDADAGPRDGGTVRDAGSDAGRADGGGGDAGSSRDAGTDGAATVPRIPAGCAVDHGPPSAAWGVVVFVVVLHARRRRPALTSRGVGPSSRAEDSHRRREREASGRQVSLEPDVVRHARSSRPRTSSGSTA